MFLSGHSIKWWDLRANTSTNTSANTKKKGIFRLLSGPARYIKRKIETAYKKLVKKEPKKTFKDPNILENEVYNEENLKKKVNRWVKRDG